MMRLIVLFGAAFLAACSNAPVRTVDQTRSVANDPVHVYLRTGEFPSASQSRLLAAAEGKTELTLRETATLVAEYAASPEFRRIQAEYVDRIYKILGINPKRSSKWIKENAEFYKGIRNYIGDSGDGDYDPDPSWQTINGKLRSGEAFNEADRKFYDEILSSLSQLPNFQGLAFRGIRIRTELWDSLEVGKIWPQPAFTSATIDPRVARSFGTGFPGHTRTGILVLKLKSGVPVSPLTFDGGTRGQPGRFEEYEVLLVPDRNLLVQAKLEDQETCYVFAEEI